MKIGFDAKRYFANYTGLGNYSRTLIENLVTYHPENQYLLYTHGKDLETSDQFPISDPMVSVMTPGTRLGRSNGALWRSFFLTRDLAANKPDIYHGLSHEIPVGIHRLKGLKTVVTIHDLIFLRYPRFYRWSERAIYLRKFKYSCRHADRIVSVSEQTKQDIIQFFGTPAEKIETVYQSCDPVFLLPVTNIKRRRIKERYQLPDQYVLYVGSFNERKNLSSLIDGLAIMKRNLDVPLVMIGSGKQYKSTVIAKIKMLGLNHRVLILSDVPNKDLPAIYQLAKLFVYPSIFEGFGIPIIEAISSRIPVITSSGSCFMEAGGPATRYVDSSNPEEIAAAMEAVLTDSALAARMIAEGMDYISRFHGQETSSRLVRIYQDLKK